MIVPAFLAVRLVCPPPILSGGLALLNFALAPALGQVSVTEGDCVPPLQREGREIPSKSQIHSLSKPATMLGLPSRTVTFIFTDVWRSTRLLQKYSA